MRNFGLVEDSAMLEMLVESPDLLQISARVVGKLTERLGAAELFVI